MSGNERESGGPAVPRPATETLDAAGELAVRRAKRDRLREAGIDPYPPRFARTHAIEAARALFREPAPEVAAPPQERVTVAGRVRSLRDHGKTWFATIEDDSSADEAKRRIQLYLKKDLLGDAFAVVKALDIGDFVGAAGELFKTRMGEISVQVDVLTLLSKSLEPLPDKWHGLADKEVRYRRRYLDLIANPDVREVFRKRAAMVAEIRAFLTGRGFIEVETPMMQAMAGGAAARPFVTHHNTLGIDLFLRIAPELYLKRLIVGGFERVFELNRNFRNEGMDRNHNPEFTMLEVYQAYADYNGMMELAESLVAAAARKVAGGLEVSWGDDDRVVNLAPPWPRVPFFEAIRAGGGPALVPGDEPAARAAVKAAGLEPEPEEGPHASPAANAPSRPEPSYADCLNALFDRFAEPNLFGPVFVTDYPTATSPLAKRRPDNPHLVERFEAYLGGMEIANAFSELNDPDDQEARFRAQSPVIDEDYVSALRVGLPPTGGLGIGIDRLAMVLCGARTIRDVILFPAMRPE